MESGIGISITAFLLAVTSVFIPFYGTFLTVPAALLAVFAIHKGAAFGMVVLLIDIVILYVSIFNASPV